MEGEKRREKLMELLKENEKALSGAELARILGVSRQIIVQDIALLRAADKNILSTNKGYVLFHSDELVSNYRRIIRVKHSTEEILDELYTIVDYGGRVLAVIVEHEIYGQITVDLIINSRKDADEFYKKIKQNQTRPLKELTGGVHYHTIEASSEEILKDIEEALKEKGYLFP